MNVELRRATVDDVAFLTSVWLEANYERLKTRADWDERRFVEGFTEQTIDEVEGREPGSITYVVEDRGESVGRLRVVRAPGELFVAAIQMAPGHQSKGLGRRVLASLVTEAQASNARLTLEVEKDNPRAKQLYLKFGFEVVEDRNDREYMMYSKGSMGD